MKYRNSDIFGETEIETDDPMWTVPSPMDNYTKGFAAGREAERERIREAVEGLESNDGLVLIDDVLRAIGEKPNEESEVKDG